MGKASIYAEGAEAGTGWGWCWGGAVKDALNWRESEVCVIIIARSAYARSCSTLSPSRISSQAKVNTTSPAAKGGLFLCSNNPVAHAPLHVQSLHELPWPEIRLTRARSGWRRMYVLRYCRSACIKYNCAQNLHRHSTSPLGNCNPSRNRPTLENPSHGTTQLSPALLGRACLARVFFCAASALLRTLPAAAAARPPP